MMVTAGIVTRFTLQANDDINADMILTFPANDGTASQSLITDGEGNLSWGAPSGGTGAYDLNGTVINDRRGMVTRRSRLTRMTRSIFRWPGQISSM